MVYSSIVSLNLMKGYSIMRTQSVEETCQFIYSLTNKIFKMKSRYSNTKIEGKCKGKINL